AVVRVLGRAHIFVVQPDAIEGVLSHDVRVVFDVRVDAQPGTGAGLGEDLGGCVDAASLGAADHPGEPVLLHDGLTIVGFDAGVRGVSRPADAPRVTLRRERDTLGEIDVPADALWGAQTQRAVGNYPISRCRAFPAFIRAFDQVTSP